MTATPPEPDAPTPPEGDAAPASDVTGAEPRPDSEPTADVRTDIPGVDPDWPQQAVSNDPVE